MRRPGRVATITLLNKNEKKNAYAERPEMQQWGDENKHYILLHRSAQVAVHSRMDQQNWRITRNLCGPGVSLLTVLTVNYHLHILLQLWPIAFLVV